MKIIHKKRFLENKKKIKKIALNGCNSVIFFNITRCKFSLWSANPVNNTLKSLFAEYTGPTAHSLSGQ